MKPRKLLVATTNKKKLIELQPLVSDLGLELVCLADLPKYSEVPEDGKTFSENASLKALGYAKQSGLLTLAEDSGLCCDALEGAPGIYSARFSQKQGTDAQCNSSLPAVSKDNRSEIDLANNLKLLKLLEKVPDNCRGAHFKSAVAIAESGRLIGVAEGEVHGVISHEIRGTNGFGYDSVFVFPKYQKTFGEVPHDMKTRVSHRMQALQKTKIILEKYLAT